MHKNEMPAGGLQKRFIIWIDSSDTHYEEKMGSFLSVHYGDQMAIHHWEEYRQGFLPEPDAVLFTDRKEDLLKAYPDVPSLFDTIVELVSDERREGVLLHQSGHGIAHAILDIMKEKQKEKMNFLTEEAVSFSKVQKVFGVIAPTDGLSHFVLSLSLAIAIQQKYASRVLFIGFSELSPQSLFFRQLSQLTWADVMYRYWMQKETPFLQDGMTREFLGENWKPKFEEEKGILYLRSPLMPDEYYGLSEEQMQYVFSCLKEEADVIVCDFSPAAFPIAAKLAKVLDVLVLIEGSSPYEEYKLASFYQAVSDEGGILRDKFRVVSDTSPRGETVESALMPDKESSERWNIIQDSYYFQMAQSLAREYLDE